MQFRWSAISQLKRNIVINIAGKVWIAGLIVVMIPAQVKLLGLEAVGLLGFIASLQVLFTVLDLGLSSTVTREVAMAPPSSGDRRTGELVQALSFVYWATGLAIGLGMYVAAEWIGRRWLHFESLSDDTAVKALRIIGISMAVRWPIALYSGVLAGLQRRDLVSLLDSGAATFRLLGGLVVLLISRDLQLFLAWTLLAALVELAAFMLVASSSLKGTSLVPRFSIAPLKRIWRFAMAMNLIGLFTIVFTQSDRQVIAKVLSVEALGCYSVAYGIASLLGGVPGLVTTAIFPTLAADFGAGDEAGFVRRYVRGSQLIMLMIAWPAFALMFSGHDILRAWISEEMAGRAATTMALLALGFLLSALHVMGYIAALAAGRPNVSNWVNFSAIWIYIPGLYYCTKTWGGVGAASVWVGLNAYASILLLSVVHAGILKRSVIAWAVRDVGPIIAAAALSVAAAKGLSQLAFRGNVVVLAALGAVALAAYAWFGLRRIGTGFPLPGAPVLDPKPNGGA